MEMESELMTIREASEYLRISPNTLYAWVCKRTIGCKRIGKKAVRFTKEDLDAMISSHQAEPKPTPEQNPTKRGRPKTTNINIDKIIEKARKEVLS